MKELLLMVAIATTMTTNLTAQLVFKVTSKSLYTGTKHIFTTDYKDLPSITILMNQESMLVILPTGNRQTILFNSPAKSFTDGNQMLERKALDEGEQCNVLMGTIKGSLEERIIIMYPKKNKSVVYTVKRVEPTK
jgi:hypothetical protein